MAEEKPFPWLTSVIEKFSTSFASVYQMEDLEYLYRNIEAEFQIVLKKSCKTKRAKALFDVLTYFYNHFRWKINGGMNTMCIIMFCAEILSYLIQTGLILSKGRTSSGWLKRILIAIKMFPGDEKFVYHSLAVINNLKQEFLGGYVTVLRHSLFRNVPKHIEEPLVYLKLILLFRRLKLLGERTTAVDVMTYASEIKPPHGIIEWFHQNISDVSHVKPQQLNKQLISGKLKQSVWKKIRQLILEDTCIDWKSSKHPEISKDEEDELFVIDTSSAVEVKKVAKEEKGKSHDTEVLISSKLENTKKHKVIT